MNHITRNSEGYVSSLNVVFDGFIFDIQLRFEDRGSDPQPAQFDQDDRLDH